MPATARTPDGLDGVRAFTAYGRTVALLGSSGGGKSAIVNCFLGEERLRTKEVRGSDSRGRHTTTCRELIPLADGGAVIDTPAMRELQLWAGQESVDRTFNEIAENAEVKRHEEMTDRTGRGRPAEDVIIRGENCENTAQRLVIRSINEAA